MLRVACCFFSLPSAPTSFSCVTLPSICVPSLFTWLWHGEEMHTFFTLCERMIFAVHILYLLGLSKRGLTNIGNYVSWLTFIAFTERERGKKPKFTFLVFTNSKSAAFSSQENGRSTFFEHTYTPLFPLSRPCMSCVNDSGDEVTRKTNHIVSTANNKSCTDHRTKKNSHTFKRNPLLKIIIQGKNRQGLAGGLEINCYENKLPSCGSNPNGIALRWPPTFSVIWYTDNTESKTSTAIALRYRVKV